MEMISINPRKTGGQNPPPDRKFYFLIWKQASKTVKLLDFLNSILTNPMVPNLAHVLYQDGSQGLFRD